MSLVVAWDDIKPDQVNRVNERSGPGVRTTTFFRASIDAPESPSANVHRYIPAHFSTAHYHVNDQFQIILDGKGKFGRHDVSAYCVHFARAYTRYGPLLTDKEMGWTLLTLRTHYDPGAQRSAEAKLKQMPGRQPWQMTKKIAFQPQGPGITLKDIVEIKDDQGLFMYALTMAPHTRTVSPSPSGGDGQYIVVVGGSLVYDSKEHKALTMVFLKPGEDAFEIAAGAQGLEGLILNFPQLKSRPMQAKTPSTQAGFKKWECILCSFAYDEARGMPEDGIPPGTRWENVPDSWSCPDCGATKSDFQMVEV